jgi:hypothetical protein
VRSEVIEVNLGLFLVEQRESSSFQRTANKLLQNIFIHRFRSFSGFSNVATPWQIMPRGSLTHLRYRHHIRPPPGTPRKAVLTSADFCGRISKIVSKTLKLD